MESIDVPDFLLLVVQSRHVKELTDITVNATDIDAEYEALCAEFEGALV